MRRARVPAVALAAGLLLAGCGGGTVVRSEALAPQAPTATGAPPLREAVGEEELDRVAALLRRLLVGRGAQVDRTACQATADAALGCEVVAETRGGDPRRFTYEARPTGGDGYDFVPEEGDGLDPDPD